MFVTCTDADVTTSTLYFPEAILRSGIRDFAFKRVYYFSRSHPIAIPKLRDLSYLMARALVHIQLQRRYLTQYEEHKQESWKAIASNHTGLGSRAPALTDFKSALLRYGLFKDITASGYTTNQRRGATHLAVEGAFLPLNPSI